MNYSIENVIVDLNDKDYVLTINEARELLRDAESGSEVTLVLGDDITLDKDKRLKIMRQLHGQLYV